MPAEYLTETQIVAGLLSETLHIDCRYGLEKMRWACGCAGCDNYRREIAPTPIPDDWRFQLGQVDRDAGAYPRRFSATVVKLLYDLQTRREQV